MQRFELVNENDGLRATTHYRFDFSKQRVPGGVQGSVIRRAHVAVWCYVHHVEVCA